MYVMYSDVCPNQPLTLLIYEGQGQIFERLIMPTQATQPAYTPFANNNYLEPLELSPSYSCQQQVKPRDYSQIVQPPKQSIISVNSSNLFLRGVVWERWTGHIFCSKLLKGVPSFCNDRFKGVPSLESVILNQRCCFVLFCFVSVFGFVFMLCFVSFVCLFFFNRLPV